MFDPSIPALLRDAVDRELQPNERVEWIGMPRPAFFTKSSTGSFLFAIFWTGFAVFWTAGVSWGTSSFSGRAGPMSFFPLFGLPFILIGIWLLSAPFWAYLRDLKTVYVITDQRAITFSAGRSMIVHSFPPSKLQDVYRKEKSDGSGDIVIALRDRYENDARQSEELGFHRIADVRAVEMKLKQLAEMHTRHQATPI